MEKKSLVLTTILAALALFGGASYYHFMGRSAPVPLQTAGFLSLGKASAPIEIVLIEDFRCRNCREFSEKMLPKIQAEYIQKGIARFTLVPVSFLAGSQAMANAALEVYEKHPDRFFSFLTQILIQSEAKDVSVSDLIRTARKVGGINLAQLQMSIEKGAHDRELERNLRWAQQLMGASFRTPALYVNGVQVYSFTYAALKERIEKLREKRR